MTRSEIFCNGPPSPPAIYNLNVGNPVPVRGQGDIIYVFDCNAPPSSPAGLEFGFWKSCNRAGRARDCYLRLRLARVKFRLLGG